MKRCLLLALVFLALSLLAVAPVACRNPAGSPSQPKAAIIDQLYLLDPNPAFVAETTDVLESGGFAVDLWQGEEITVDFYRELPERGYSLIIFRVHSGILLSLLHAQIVPSETTYLFTGETYDKTRYQVEQLSDRVSNAMMTTEYPLVFAVNSDFIREDMEGSFDDTLGSQGSTDVPGGVAEDRHQDAA